MKEENRCMGCMELKGGAEVCPHCGYSENAPRIETYLPPRSIIGNRYIVGKVLSYNGEGVTYLGYDAIAARKVDIREYFPDTLAVREADGQGVSAKSGCQIAFKTYLSDFVEMMEKLSHMRTLSCLVQVWSLQEQNGTVYAIMEHVEGFTLQEYLDRRGLMLTWTEASDLLLPVFKTLQMLHQEGIIHRGVSPSTIYLGRGGVRKLGGFGISAVRAARTELVAELFPGYSAPEQYSTVSLHGTWTDVYAVCALLYDCTTAQCPPEALIRSAASELPSPRERNETIPPRVSLAILQGLALRPEDRIRTLNELLARIGGPFQSGGDSPTISIPAARPTDTGSRPAVKTATSSRPAVKPRQMPEKSKVVQGTSDRRLLINSMLISLPILMAILIFTFWYLFGNRDNRTESSQDNGRVPFSSGTLVSSGSGGTTPSSSGGFGQSSAQSSTQSSEPSSTASSSEESSEPLPKMVNLVGMRYEDVIANAEYQALCSFAEPEYIYSDTEESGIIVWQSVASGSQLPEGTVVRLKVSKGSQYVTIPSYEKLTEEEYTALLTQLGIQYTVIYREDNTYPEGYVVGLDRMEGSKYDLEKAAVVQVYVCKEQVPTGWPFG